MNEHTTAAQDDLLARDLASYLRPDPRRHARWSGRMAVTFERHRRCPDHAVPYDGWDLCTLRARAGDGPGGPPRRLVLSKFRPAFDPALGRVALRPLMARDLEDIDVDRPGDRPVDAELRRHEVKLAALAVALARALEDAGPADLAPTLRLPVLYWLFDADAPPVLEATHTAGEWAAAEVAIDGRRGWPAAMFARSSSRRLAVHPADGSVDPWAEGVAAADAADHGSWALRDGIAYPRCQAPAAVVTFLAPYLGRTVRNPAHAALAAHGLAGAADADHAAWLGRLAIGGARRVYPQPAWDYDAAGVATPANEAARYRDGLEAEMAGRHDSVLAAMAEHARAAGVAVDDADPDRDDMALLLQSPWLRPAAHGRFFIQVLNLGGVPDRQTLAFRTDVYDADLYNQDPVAYDRGSRRGDDGRATGPGGRRRRPRGGKKCREKKAQVAGS